MAGLFAAGCSGSLGSVADEPDDDDDGEAACTAGENVAPDAPDVTEPIDGRMDVLADELVIRSSDFVDPDGGEHQATEVEIWLMAGDEPAIRVWRAEVEDADRLTEVHLSDGEFEVSDRLEEWEDYAVKARYRDAGECDAWSEWSDLRRFKTDDGSTAWFAPDAMNTIDITVPPESYDAINAQAKPPGCVPFVRQYYPGTVTIDGETFEGAGIRTKGGCGSSRTLDQKASWKINLSWDDESVQGCPGERRIHGLKRFTLNNQVQDRTFVHEMLAYHFYKLMGVATPRANHVRVNVNGAFWGVYLNLESLDRRFLSRWFDSSKGMLYEGTYYCDLVPENVPPGEEDTYCIARKFHPSVCEPTSEDSDPEDYTVVREMTAQLATMPAGSFYPEIEQIWDFDAFLSLWAVENIIGHWDGYSIQIVNNYRMYHDRGTGKWSIIPTGLDQTFGQSTAIDKVAGLLAQRCWAEDDCRAAFQARVAQAVDVFEQADLQSFAASIRDHIMADVMEDPRKEGTYDEFVNGVTATIEFINRRPAEVRASLGL
jgi:hypothetical protein